MTWTQKKEVMNNLNDSALVLLEFYYSKANVPKYDFKDSEVSNGIGWSESKVKKYRLSLEKKGYFHKEITRNSKSTTLNIIVGHIEWSEK